MRHGDLRLTSQRYTDTAGLAMNDAVGRLPAFDLTAGGMHKYANRFPAKRVKSCRNLANGNRKKSRKMSLMSALAALRREVSRLGEWCALQGSNLLAILRKILTVNRETLPIRRGAHR